MSSKDAHLYGIPRPQKSSKSKDIPSANSFAFSNALSTLISASKPASSTTTTASPSNISNTVRTRPGKAKIDIFSSHNRNINKRAAADMLAVEAETRAQAVRAGARLDEDSWRRTKRKMEEKARLYAAMKRGDVEDDGEKHMVDFDRKWAEQGKAAGGESEDDEDEDEDEEQVEYMDEFGRTRKGTRAEAAREQRRRMNAVDGRSEPEDRFTARPAQPSNIIFGDTIQAAAFNPDDATTEAMADLAARRDREATPPEAVHYDAAAEIRTKGTGFFRFATDEDERKRQMEELEKERMETERMRREKEGEMAAGHDGKQDGSDGVEDAKTRRRREVEERRRMLAERRGKVRADRFLDELGGELLQTVPDTMGAVDD